MQASTMNDPLQEELTELACNKFNNMDEIDSSRTLIDENIHLNAYDFVQLCYQADNISLEILEEVWPTVEFLVSTAAVSCEYGSTNYNDTGYMFYEQQQPESPFKKFYRDNDVFVSPDENCNISDEEDDDDKESVVASTSASDIQNEEVQLSDRLDIDAILENELKQLNFSRQTRRQNRRKYKFERNTLLMSGLMQKCKTVGLVADNDKNLQTDSDLVLSNSIFSECFGALSRIADTIPESNDDLDDYRLACSMYVNTRLLEKNKDLNWKVDLLGKCLKRSMNELCLLRIALQNTVGDLQNEIELLRKNTLATIRRIIQGDIKRREQVQEQWDEVQSFIRRKNRRIAELTEQLNGADLEVGFLLASHKERIESAAFAERNFFRASERLEDLELELKKKRCAHCETNRESTVQERIEQEEIQRRREEKRKQFEDNEKQQFACAERYGKAIQNHIDSAFQDFKNSNLPWHDNAEKQQNGGGQPAPNAHNRVAQMSSNFGQYTTNNSNQKINGTMQPSVVPFEVYQLTRFRCEEMEKEAKKQERMNEILSRDLTDSKATMTRMKTENVELVEENKKLLAEVSKLKMQCQFYRKNAKPLINEDRQITPDVGSADKIKDEFNNLPKPPSPPEFLEKSPRLVKNSPKIIEPSAPKRKFEDITERQIEPRYKPGNLIKTQLTKAMDAKNGDIRPKEVMQRIEQPPIERRYFSPVQRVRRSISPEPKRPAFGLAPPPLLPPQRSVPSFYKDTIIRHEQESPMRDRFYKDLPATQSNFRSFSPERRRRDISPPSPQFEPMHHGLQELRNNRRPPASYPNNWQTQLRTPSMQSFHPRPMNLNEMRPSLRPPQLSPTPPNPIEMRPLRPWHNAPHPHLGIQIRPPLQVRSTSWINHASFGRR